MAPNVRPPSTVGVQDAVADDADSAIVAVAEPGGGAAPPTLTRPPSDDAVPEAKGEVGTTPKKGRSFRVRASDSGVEVKPIGSTDSESVSFSSSGTNGSGSGPATNPVDGSPEPAGDDAAPAPAPAPPLLLPPAPPSTPVSDLLRRAEALYSDDKLLASARVLRTVDPPSLTDHHRSILREADACEELVTDLKGDVSEGHGWKKQGESHGRHHSVIYHKIDEETETQLTARIETPIDKGMLVPILSVLNETELYKTWLPNWAAPRLRVKRSVKLRQTGRCSQVLAVSFEMPWPVTPREVVLDAVGFDDIDGKGNIAIRLHSLGTGDENGLVPPPDDDGTMRVDFRGGFLFRKCPEDHPARAKVLKQRRKERRHQQRRQRQRSHQQQRGRHRGFRGPQHRADRHRAEQHQQEKAEAEMAKEEEDDDDDDDLILVTFAMFTDAKVAHLSQGFLIFVVKTAMGAMWNKFLRVAEDVRDGRRPGHAAAIEAKRASLYDWVEERAKRMLEILGGGLAAGAAAAAAAASAC